MAHGLGLAHVEMYGGEFRLYTLEERGRKCSDVFFSETNHFFVKRSSKCSTN